MTKIEGRCQGFRDLMKGFGRWYLLGASSLLAVNLLDLVPPMALGNLIDAAAARAQEGFPVLIATGYIASLALQNLLRFPMRVGFLGVASRIASSLRCRVGTHLLEVSPESLDSFTPGDLLTRSTGDIDTVERALGMGFLFMVDSLIYLVTIPAVLLVLSPALALYAAGPLLLIPLLAGLFIPRIVRVTEKLHEASGRVTDQVLEAVQACQTIRSYGLEDRVSQRFDPKAKDVYDQSVRLAKHEIAFSAGVQVLIMLSVYLLLTFGAGRVVRGDLSTGRYVAFLQYIGMTAWPLTGLSWGILLLRKGESGLRRIQELLSLPSASGESQSPPAPGECLEIEIRDLTYRRPGATVDALSGVTLKVRRGETVAIMGPIGSGKSTLIDLLTGLAKPPPGKVFIRGVDVSTLTPEALGRWCAVVPQNAYLFSGTLESNIRLGDVRRLLTGEEIAQVASDAQLPDQAMHLGLLHPVSQGGSNLSGGQRQRVAMARCLVREAPIMILDDMGASLDVATEEALFRHIARRQAGKTLLYVTHRPAAAQTAGRIVLLARGGIEEQGTHDELSARKGLYSRLLERQLIEEVSHAR